MSGYFLSRQAELLQDFAADASHWRPLLNQLYGSQFARDILKASRIRFQSLIPHIPCIGGEDSWTGSFLESIRCLAFYQEMKKAGKTAEETGQILYAAVLSRQGEPQPALPAGQALTSEELMEKRRQRASRSQERRYSEGYVAEFIPGDGAAFDYGYNFIECAAQKFFHAQGAEEFLPFFCQLDFAYSQLYGLGLNRTVTLAEGGTHCDHRFTG